MRFDRAYVGNAICGVWGGYSQETVIAGNELRDNGAMAYGNERGGVNIEHGAGIVIRNSKPSTSGRRKR